MGEYFKPRRRRIGVLTLVLACGLMVGWLRSRWVEDSLAIAFSGNTWEARSSDSLLELMWHRRFGSESLSLIDLDETRWLSHPISRASDVEVTGDAITIRLMGFDTRSWIYQKKAEFGGLVIASGEKKFFPDNPEYGSRVESDLIALPYWLIVILLTVLSACLLLSQPKHLKPNTNPPV